MSVAVLRGLGELARPVNAIAAGALTFLGAFVAGAAADAPVAAVVALVATILATAAGNAINDYFDRDIDRINNPDRPIPRGAVPPRLALGMAAVAFVLALGMVLLWLPLLAIVIALINLVALVAYTELFKGLPGIGNAVVAYLGGSTFLFGAAAVDALGTPPLVLALLAALSTLAREIIKDVEDVEGDKAEGLTTLPIAIGKRRSLWIATVLLLVAVISSPLPYLAGIFSVAYLAVVLPADGIMVYAGVRAFDDPSTGQSLMKYGMFLAAGAFVIGRAVQFTPT